jgi:phosphoglycerate kinase
LFDEEGAKIVQGLVEKAKAKNVRLHFPGKRFTCMQLCVCVLVVFSMDVLIGLFNAVDYVVGDKFAKDAQADKATDESGIPEGWMGLDVGPRSTEIFVDAIKRAKTILWNGCVVLY